MVRNGSFKPSARELVAGLVVLLVVAGVIVTRGEGPRPASAGSIPADDLDLAGTTRDESESDDDERSRVRDRPSDGARTRPK